MTGTGVGVHETHCGVVFLVGDRAYKLKKPVDLGFLDFTRREAREAVCHREVELNRRLAPDVYLGVADVTGPDGEPCDHVVVMRRMPEDRRMSRLAAEGTLGRDTLDELAATLAAFHRGADRGPAISAQGRRDALAARWRQSFGQVRPFVGHLLTGEVMAEITSLVEEYLAGRAELFDRRITEGRVVDGHADLLADDVFVLDDGVRVLDCLEFDDALRAVDGLDDAAFLAMDLERLGAPELGEWFLDRYLAHAQDHPPLSLRHHYLAYRAFVRAKVACLRHAQGDATAADQAWRHLALTVRHLRAGQVRLVLVGGLPGTGKSTLAEALADHLGARVLHSDEVRKELAGLTPDTDAAADWGEGIYDPAHTRALYDEVLRRATTLLAQGETVVVDASWSDTDPRRRAAEAAASARAGLVRLRCSAPRATTTARLGAPRGHGSDAGTAVAERMAAVAAPWPQARTINTAGTVDDSLRQALDCL